MRIAILHREYPPHTVWMSTSVLYQDLAKAFAGRGHEVHVICQSAGTPLEREDDGVLVHEVGADIRRGSPLARTAYSFHAWRKLRELLRRRGIDVVNAEFFLGEGFLFSLRKGSTPLVLQVHSWAEGWLEADNYLETAQGKVVSYLEKFTARRADSIIVTSRSTYQWLLERVHIPPERAAIIYEPIDTARYKPVKSSLRERLDIPRAVPLVLFASNLQPRKGPHIFAQAIPFVMRHLPETKFVIAGMDTDRAPGGGSMKAFMQDLVEKEGFGSNVVFVGSLSGDEIVQAYSACDLFVYPGLLEAGGKPPIEALACNRPIVATATGSAAELDQVSPALLVVPPGDSQSLAEAITRLLQMPREERERMAAGHRDIVEERFSFEQIVDQTLAVYEQAIGKRSRR